MNEIVTISGNFDDMAKAMGMSCLLYTSDAADE
mgnify:CR=1 FL=1